MGDSWMEVDSFQELLHHAQNGDDRVVRNAVLENPSLVKRVGSYGATLLYHSIRYPDMMSFLIEKGSDVNIQVWGGTTILINACENNDTNAAKMLLKAGANPNIKKNGDSYVSKTPLAIAIEKKYYELSDLLIRNGAIAI